ncbi:MAG: glycerol-3-phosphate dehydrogenase/oxidase [Acidobacteria bacterium]|nr:glycerol-3-phosphate dehydrogenase/oxidase [Acidobacteriota bacterium]MCG3192580.1 Aerobic glycerol-3-phosphate dehydrogenase [Thermoanaerobaculia bacterium]
MNSGESRRKALESASRQGFDLLIIGGGITGAGILKEAVELGLTAILVEQRDFAWGTSSRSSKLVHGGLRYLAQGKLRLTRDSVRERQRLLSEAPGLVEPLDFLLPTYRKSSPGPVALTAGLTLYDLLALSWSHRSYGSVDFQMLAPRINARGLEGGFRYRDAQTDDARLVFRLIREAVLDGALAFNDTSVEDFVRTGDKIQGAVVRDQLTRETFTIRAKAVINATGVWADKLRSSTGGSPKLRPLRGSHLVFPAWRLPVAQAVGFSHPKDRRPVFLLPWEGVTLAGTTDVDHSPSLDREPSISDEEVQYILDALTDRFPAANLGRQDVLSTFSGVRPVVASGTQDPSKESRDHAVWEESGLVTVTGGKLTTFRLIARDALEAARKLLGRSLEWRKTARIFDPVEPGLLDDYPLEPAIKGRLLGRHGKEAPEVLRKAPARERALIPGTGYLWAELRWALCREAVHHLDDLLLRRTRIGLVLPEGGAGLFDRVETLCTTEAGWSRERWEVEKERYLELHRTSYSLSGARAKMTRPAGEPKRDTPEGKNQSERAVPIRV